MRKVILTSFLMGNVLGKGFAQIKPSNALFSKIQSGSDWHTKWITWGIGGSLGMPISYHTVPRSNIYQHAFTWFGQFEMALWPFISVTSSLGYAYFFPRGDLSDYRAKMYTKYGPASFPRNYSSAGSHFLPIKVGTKCYFLRNFYGALELGASFAINNQEYCKELNRKYKRNYIVTSAVAPGIGIFIPIVGDHNGIDLGIRYEIWQRKTIWNVDFPRQLAIHVAYAFLLSEKQKL